MAKNKVIEFVSTDDINAANRLEGAMKSLLEPLRVAAFGKRSKASFLLTLHEGHGFGAENWHISVHAFENTPDLINDFQITLGELTSEDGFNGVVHKIKSAEAERLKKRRAEFLKLKEEFGCTADCVEA